jgi:hypothetical protein
MKMIKRYLFIIMLAFGALMFAAACSSDSDGGSAEIPPVDDGLISVRYKMNGGVTNDLGNTSDVVLRGITPGTLFIDLPDKPAPLWVTWDRAFVAWNTQEDGKGTDYYPETPVLVPEGERELVLYAVYAEDIISDFISTVVCNDPDVVYTISGDAALGRVAPTCSLPGQAFMGKLYGNGYKVSYALTTLEAISGLFGHLDGAVISDLVVEFAETSGYSGTETTGILAGTARNSVIKNVSVSGPLTGRANAVVGGVVGELYNSTIYGAASNALFTIVSASADNITMGGIAGYLGEGGVITDSMYKGTTTLTTNVQNILGGIAGINDGGIIKSAYSDSILRSTGTNVNTNTTVGGIVGDFRSGTVQDSLAFGTMINGTAAGRIAGNIEPGASVENNYAKGDMLVNYETVADSDKDGEKITTSAVLKSRAFFRDTLNYDFNAVWIMPDYYDFPAFLWQQNDLPAYEEISSATELQDISGDGLYVLFNDIDLSALNIGETNAGEWTQIPTFSGTLDGNGHTISNLKMSAAGNLSMFGTVSGTIKNVKFDNLNIAPATPGTVKGSNTTMAALAQTLSATGVIESVQVSGNIIGGNNMGGLAANHYGIISHSSFNGIVASDYTETASYVGGFASTAYPGSYILFSSSAGSREYRVLPGATRALAKYLAGLVGYSTGNAAGGQGIYIISSYSTADFHSEAAAVNMGGITGYLYNIGNTTNPGAVFINTYATGNVSSAVVRLGTTPTGTSATATFGGLFSTVNSAANNRVTVRNSFADAHSVDITFNTEWQPEPPVATPLTALTLNAGGLWGSRGANGVYDYTSSTYSNNALDLTVDGATITPLAGNMITEQLPMLGNDFYRNTLGWDFDTVWKMPEGGTYPILQWQN